MEKCARFYMKRRSGMTVSAAALTSGLIASGLNAYLVVPTASDMKYVPGHFPRSLIRVAGQHHLTDPASAVYVFDDAERCAFEFSKHGEGDMLKCVQARFQCYPDELTRAYLFQYSL